MPQRGGGRRTRMSIGITEVSKVVPKRRRRSYGVSKKLKKRPSPSPCTSLHAPTHGYALTSYSSTSLVIRGFQPSKPAAGAVPATGSNAVPTTASGGPPQPSAGPSNGYAKTLAAASALHSDDENLNPDVALRRKEKEEKKRRKAEKKAAKEEKKRIEEEERERRAMESVGRERERLYERKSRRDDRRGWDRRDDDRHKRKGERQLTPLEDRPWVAKQERNSRSRSPPPRRPRSLDRERRSTRYEPYDEATMVRERERDRRRWEESSRRRDGGIDHSRR